MTKKTVWVFYKGYEPTEDEKIREIVGCDNDGSGYCFSTDQRDMDFSVPEDRLDEIVKSLNEAGYKTDVPEENE